VDKSHCGDWSTVEDAINIIVILTVGKKTF